MALIKCRYCGKDISDKSNKCIHCGKKIINDHEYEKKQKKKELKKIKFKKLKKILLTIISIFAVYIIIVVLGLIFPIKSIDFTVKYKDYLDYALGKDWKVISTEKYYTYKPIWIESVYTWTISYKDANNESQTIKIYNDDLAKCKNEKECSDYIFAESISYAYREKINEKLEKENISKLDKYINILDTYENYDENEGTLYSIDSTKLIDSKNGLSFKEITFDQINDEYHYLELSVWYSSGSNLEEYTIEQSKLIIEKYNMKNAIISVSLPKGDGSAHPVYCIKNNEEVTCPNQNDLGSMNKIFINKSKYINLYK